MSYKYVVKYLDGRVEEVTPPPRARIETEKHFGGLKMEQAQEQTFYLAWCSLNKRGMESAEFDTWLDLIDDVEELEVKEPDPTPPSQPTTTSPESAS